MLAVDSHTVFSFIGSYQLYFSSGIYSLCFWNRVLLCCPHWPEVCFSCCWLWTCNIPLASHVLGLQSWTFLKLTHKKCILYVVPKVSKHWTHVVFSCLRSYLLVSLPCHHTWFASFRVAPQAGSLSFFDCLVSASLSKWQFTVFTKALKVKGTLNFNKDLILNLLLILGKA